MLYPSIDSLLKKIDSKYSLVTIAAKRARDLQQNDNPVMEEYQSHKFVGKALEEIYQGILVLDTEEDRKEA